jgi:uroporphyrinogen decarboxylase
VLSHPRLFPEFESGSVDYDEFPPVYRQNERFVDNWGCEWYNSKGGLEGQVVGHPLEHWEAFDAYHPPDVETQSERGSRDWHAEKEEIESRRARGLLTVGHGERLFDRLYFLRGFENLMIDFALEEPHLPQLIAMLRDYEREVVGRYLDIGVDVVGFHTDIGTQNGLMISPAAFRRYLKPMFKELFSLCRGRGAHVLLSSDGKILEIVDDLIECGVSIHDPQYRANTIEGIKEHYLGRLCINLDLDRQMFAFCTPEEIQRHVETAVEELSLPEGGLMISGSVWDDITPLENIEALCDAIDETCFSREDRSGTVSLLRRRARPACGGGMEA